MEKIEISEEESKMLDIIQKLVTTGVEQGVKKALEKVKQEEIQKEKQTYDIKFKNTKLLIKNYRKFIKSCANTTYSENKLKTATVQEILDTIECTANNEVTVVQSILASKKRTEIMLAHINKIINLYIKEAESSCNVETIRRAHILKDLYITGKKQPRISDMSERYHVGERQVHRDVKAAIGEISILMFGVDGIRKMY